MEIDTILLPWSWELICIHSGELEAEPLQTYPTDLAVVTRHDDDPFDKMVHLVPIIALGQRSSYPFWSVMEKREMLLLDKTLSLFRRNNGSLTSLIIFDDQ
jgi:hypothetical protein